METTDPNAEALSIPTSRRLRLVRFVVLFLFIPASIPTFFLFTHGLNSVDVSVDDEIGLVNPSDVISVDKSVSLYFQAVSFDPEGQTAKFKIYPWPTEELATTYSSSAVLNEYPIRVWSDGITSANYNLFEPFSSVGAIAQEFDVLSTGHEQSANDARYPFDSYVLDTFAWVDIDDSPDNNKEDFIEISTFDFFYTTPIPGFHVSYKRTAAYGDDQVQNKYAKSSIESQRERGFISFEAKFTRSTAVKTISLIIGIFCVISALTLTWITAGIWFRRRPPSMQALVWSAASVLGTIQLRDILPGNPRIGISMDFLFFFPSLLIGLISSLLITGLWIRRDDWEI
jgi:Domain of unknown function (DUF4436)